MTTSPQEPLEPPAQGYVLRGGPLDGTVVSALRPALVHIEHYDGGAEVYRPSGVAAGEQAGLTLERYDFEAVPGGGPARPHAHARLLDHPK